MQKMAISHAWALAMTGVVSACDRTNETRMFTKGVEYVIAEAALFWDGLVKISASVKNVRSDHFATEFTACVAARYALLRRFGFACLVTDIVSRADDIRTATSVYIITARMPMAVHKLDAEFVAVNCAENGIPMV